MSDCNWYQEDYDSDTWESDCGMSFFLEEGKPSDNRMIFCCMCGKPLVEHIKEQYEELDNE